MRFKPTTSPKITVALYWYRYNSCHKFELNGYKRWQPKTVKRICGNRVCWRIKELRYDKKKVLKLLARLGLASDNKTVESITKLLSR